MVRLALQMVGHRITALIAVACAALGGAALITGTASWPSPAGASSPLFRQRAFSVGMLIGLVFFMSTVGLAVYTSLTLQSGLGLDPLRAGLGFAPVGVAFFAASLTVPRLVPRLGRSVLAIGYGLPAVGLLSTWYTVHSSGERLTAGSLAWPLLLVGAGEGFTMSPLIGIVLSGMRPDDKGSASGALTTAFQVGQALGGPASVLFSPSWVRARERRHTPTTTSTPTRSPCSS